MEHQTGTGKIWLVLSFLANGFAIVNMTTITFIMGVAVSLMACRYYYWATKKIKDDK